MTIFFIFFIKKSNKEKLIYISNRTINNEFRLTHTNCK